MVGSKCTGSYLHEDLRVLIQMAFFRFSFQLQLIVKLAIKFSNTDSTILQKLHFLLNYAKKVERGRAKLVKRLDRLEFHAFLFLFHYSLFSTVKHLDLLVEKYDYFIDFIFHLKIFGSNNIKLMRLVYTCVYKSTSSIGK